jgi:hypothetical protein
MASKTPPKASKAKAGAKAKEQQDQEEFDLDFMGSREENAEARTPNSRQRIRNKMRDDVESFLEHGGKISEIAPHVTADPPRKPQSNYGGRPI